MDSETRHQLKTNELAEALSKVRSVSDEKLIPWLVGIVVVLLAFLGYRWYSGSVESAEVAEWAKLNSVNVTATGAQGLQPLEELAKQGKTTGIRHAAMLKIGEESLRLAITTGGEVERAGLLKNAENNLKKLIAEPGVDKNNAAAGRFVLASVFESQGRPDEAEAIYNELVKTAENTPFATMARSRLDTMDAARVQVEFVPGSPMPDLSILDTGAGGLKVEATPVTAEKAAPAPAVTPEPAVETPEPQDEPPAAKPEPNKPAEPAKDPNRAEP